MHPQAHFMSSASVFLIQNLQKYVKLFILQTKFGSVIPYEQCMN